MPSSCEKPCTTSLALFLITVPASSDLFLNTHLVPIGSLLGGYQIPKVIVPYKYLNILLTTMRCDSLEEDWYLAQAHVENMIYGLDAVK